MEITAHGLTPLLQAFDMNRSVAYYRDKLGFQVIRTYSDGDALLWAQLKLGEACIMLNSMYEPQDQPETPNPQRVKHHGDTGFYFASKDVDAIAAQLRERGVDCDGPTTAFYGMRQLYLRDPDGYVLCFQERVDAA